MRAAATATSSRRRPSRRRAISTRWVQRFDAPTRLVHRARGDVPGSERRTRPWRGLACSRCGRAVRRSPRRATRGRSGSPIWAASHGDGIRRRALECFAAHERTKNGTSSSAVATTVVAADDRTANNSVLTTLGKDVRTSGGLIPAGDDDGNTVDAPIKLMLDDARTEATRLIALSSDPTCRSTVAILIVGGGEGTTSGLTNSSLETAATSFLDIAGRRVPVYVIAIAPPASDVAGLRAVATKTGGQYFEITKAQIDAALASPPVSRQRASAGASPAPSSFLEVVRSDQHRHSARVCRVRRREHGPDGALPIGPLTEFQVTSPIIGTVNLDDGKDINGSGAGPVPRSRTGRTSDSAAFERDDHDRILDAGIRRQVAGVPSVQAGGRHTKPGYNFVSDGTPLWVACVPGTGVRRARQHETKPLHRDAVRDDDRVQRSERGRRWRR